MTNCVASSFLASDGALRSPSVIFVGWELTKQRNHVVDLTGGHGRQILVPHLQKGCHLNYYVIGTRSFLILDFWVITVISHETLFGVSNSDYCNRVVRAKFM
jgi:hypothetical protein